MQSTSRDSAQSASAGRPSRRPVGISVLEHALDALSAGKWQVHGMACTFMQVSFPGIVFYNILHRPEILNGCTIRRRITRAEHEMPQGRHLVQDPCDVGPGLVRIHPCQRGRFHAPDDDPIITPGSPGIAGPDVAGGRWADRVEAILAPMPQLRIESGEFAAHMGDEQLARRVTDIGVLIDVRFAVLAVESRAHDRR